MKAHFQVINGVVVTDPTFDLGSFDFEK